MEMLMEKKELKGLIATGVLLLGLFILGFYGAESHKEDMNILSSEEVSEIEKTD